MRRFYAKGSLGVRSFFSARGRHFAACGVATSPGGGGGTDFRKQIRVMAVSSGVAGRMNWTQSEAKRSSGVFGIRLAALAGAGAGAGTGALAP